MLVVFAFSSLIGSTAPLALLTVAAVAINSGIALACYNNANWHEEALKRNLTEASTGNKMLSLLLWLLIWAVLLRYDNDALVLASVASRSLAILCIRLP